MFNLSVVECPCWFVFLVGALSVILIEFFALFGVAIAKAIKSSKVITFNKREDK